jgi:ATP synthase F1 delta subunit
MRAYETYAEALFKAAEALDQVGGISEELHDVEMLYAVCRWYLNDPRISVRDKASFLREALAADFHPLTIEFLLLLLGRHHLKHFPAAAGWYHHLSDRHFGRATVRLRIPFDLDHRLIERLEDRFVSDGLIPAGNAGNVEFHVELDKDLIGGFIADCNGRQIDASLKTALKNLM